MKVVQVAESLSLGDACSNDVVAIDELLRKMEICGGIYATNKNNIDKRYLHKIAEPIDGFPVMETDDVLLLHHAIANDFCYEVPKLKCKKVLVYHNITPPEFFDGFNDGLKSATAKGLMQTRYLHDKMDCCIADSAFNKENLEKMGYKCPIYVCPVLIPFDDYNKEPNEKIIKSFQDEWVNILFVGRIAPNKKQEDIIRTFALYKKYYNPKSRLFLVGSDGLDFYANTLREYVKILRLDDVYITGSVPFADILAYYRVANVFVCMSEHEGFCVPLVEAMYFNVPIIAYKSSAIPWTLGDSGILLEEKNYLLAAGLIDRIVKDKNLCDRILEAQKKKITDFSYEKVSAETEEILRTICAENLNREEKKTGVANSVNEYDALVVIKASDWPIAQKAIPYIKNNLNPRHMLIVSSKELADKIPDDGFYHFLDENTICDGMNLNSIREILKNAGGDPKFAGWFLQQFIKLYYSFISENQYYLAWDVDTIPLTKIAFFDPDTKKPYFNMKREYVKSYFVTINNMFGYGKSCKESFISEHMLFDAKLCQELILKIESLSHIKGNSFYEKCIYASEFGQWQQTFSEYETFGTYILHNYPDAYKKRRLRTLRLGKEFLGANPSEEMLQWASKEFDTVSFEHWSVPIEKCVSLCSKKWIRSIFSFSFIIRMICFDLKINRYFGKPSKRRQRIKEYEALQRGKEFDYFFGDKTVYTSEINA